MKALLTAVVLVGYGAAVMVAGMAGFGIDPKTNPTGEKVVDAIQMFVAPLLAALAIRWIYGLHPAATLLVLAALVVVPRVLDQAGSAE